MRTANVILMGLGNVGRAFVRLIQDKKEVCKESYGLDLRLSAAFKKDGGFFSDKSLDLADVLELKGNDFSRHPDWKPGLRLEDVLGCFKSGLLVECTPTDIKTGEPGLGHITAALKRKWPVAAASKGALVVNFKGLKALAQQNGAALKFSGATAAALPTLDVGLYSLAGAEITAIEGILTGTTNYILTRMEEGFSFEDALKEAQSRGIAEPDPALDIEGWDTACKILLISNAVVGTEFSLRDISLEGISGVSPTDVQKSRKEGKALKLLGRLINERGRARAEVRLIPIGPSHPLFNVSGANKAITFFTDTMGSITVSGGKSDPRATAAALLKDIINIYRN
jgi:homoserine dehydrogenase